MKSIAPARWLQIGLVAHFAAGCQKPAENEVAPHPPVAPRPQQVQALHALGYMDVAEDTAPGAQLGVLAQKNAKVAPGLIYYTSVGNCSSHIINNNGDVLRTWSHSPCARWSNTVLLPDGSVLAIHHYPPATETLAGIRDALALVKLNANNEVVWEAKQPVHHDVELTASGRIAVLTYAHRRFPAIHQRVAVREDWVTLLGPEGRLLERASLTEILLRSEDVFFRQMVAPQEKDGETEIDLTHTNSLVWMHRSQHGPSHALSNSDNLLVCMRNQDALVIVHWPTRKIIWTWGQGTLSGPHDASVLSNGNFLVFDNGLTDRWSRVIELDPVKRAVVWEYHAPKRSDFFSRARGASQRLPNGNTLVTNSDAGILFEVTRSGETVWKYRNPDLSRPRGKPLVIVRARRFLPRHGTGGATLFPATPTD